MYTCRPKCQNKCGQNFSQDDRKKLCSEFYNFGTWIRQNDFICSTVEVIPVSKRKALPNGQLANIKRTNSCVCFLTVGEAKHRVFKTFYCKTLCISSKRIRLALQEKGTTTSFCGNDKRKGKLPANKTADARVQLVRKHINLFPRVEPHYCRRDCSIQYLSPEPNISRMY